MSKQTITGGEWYVKAETNNVFVYNDDQSRQHPIAVFYNDEDGLALANHICNTHNAVPDMIEALKRARAWAVGQLGEMYPDDSITDASIANDIEAALRKAGQID